MRIAVLDDDPSQTDLVCQVLTSSGHICHPFQSGKEILNQLRRESYDMLVLDWQVPDLSGPEVLRWVRDKLPKTIPVLFITSRSGEDDIVEGLAAGADDYMIKPIRRSELVARVQALLRRAYPIQNSSEQIVFNDYLFETRSGRLTLAGKPIEITQKEFDLALLFFRNLGRPLSRAYILEAVWSRDVDIPSRTMDTHVSRVRSKLQLRPENGYRLAPVYSYGYRLEQLTG
ncbi:MAG: response regulator transcription factor [Collimonas sp.]|jgi:DNA-binding response OmpR family regulator|uniref:Two-component system response regulator with CheY-like receiver domain n=2 Tax=Collimonas TaxID=202907 RepID=G0ADW0_COLFT|nr:MULTISPECIES: response regulator transcription factor [Collimonas]AEK63733.1 Putative Two-component system response regulator with CheY-like receiver domain [Collimonas fungivorans Ter331]SFC55450.1 DNA-binding response regulator, OmpR family, contains REC and winged-helix (wHTH) domain [Collimonas sp. OK412]HWW04102.1 response regulator transcription factor [Collimonas sp.]